jgi:hypothetical protein
MAASNYGPGVVINQILCGRWRDGRAKDRNSAYYRTANRPASSHFDCPSLLLKKRRSAARLFQPLCRRNLRRIGRFEAALAIATTKGPEAFSEPFLALQGTSALLQGLA